MSQQEPLLTLNGRNGQLELYPHRLVVRKRGWLGVWGSSSSANKLEIELRHIKAVNLFSPQLLLNGVLTITFMDEKEQHIFLIYAPKDYEQAARIKENIEDYLSRTEVYPIIKEQRNAHG